MANTWIHATQTVWFADEPFIEAVRWTSVGQTEILCAKQALNMNETNPTECDLRDDLARDRTLLANERTLLAYLRTAIMLLASGVTLTRLFGTDRGLLTLGYALVPIAVIVGFIGYVRFVRMQRRIDKSRKPT